MRLIDADALIAQMEADAEQMEDQIAKMFAYAAINDVKHAPTVEERKTGKWIQRKGMYEIGYKCSECDAFSLTETSYCANCGAKMEGEQP